MDQNTSTKTEVAPPKPKPEVQDLQGVEQTRETPEISSQVSGTAETLEGLDVMTNGEVAEKKEKAAEQKPVQKAQKGTRAQTKKASDVQESIAEIKERLLKESPPPRIMKRQIKHEINKEINHLIGEARKAKRQQAPYKMNQIVARIRELKETLSSLAHAAFDYVRNLWLKVVHGIN